MSKLSISAAGEAMPRRSTPEYAAAWEKCRTLGKQLSQALAETGDQESAFTQPAGNEFAVGFGQLQSDTRHPIDYPAQTITRMAERISFAMNDDPEMFVERVCITPQGIYMQAKVPADTDPLVEAINAYRAGLAGFNRRTKEDTDAGREERWEEHDEATYLPWQSILDEWDEPAQTRAGAVEALRASLSQEDGLYGSPAATKMVLAALRYLEAM